jgi:ferredoxin
MYFMVKVNKDICIGCGLCVSICRDVFKIGDDGKSQVKSQKKLPCIKEAIDECPVGAISE